MKNASPGVFISNNGKFAEKGGVLGIDFVNCKSILEAITKKLINSNWGKSLTRERFRIKSLRRTWSAVSVLFLGHVEDGSQTTRKQAH